MDSSNKGIWYWDLVKWITGMSLLLYLFFFLYFGFTETANRQAIRWTARVSFVCFTLAFGANAIHQIVKNSLSFWLLMNRKHLGIAFAISHYIHLLFLGLLQGVFHPVFTLANRTSLGAGMIAYGFMTLMLFTSFDRFSALISKKQWKWLHTIGGYWIGGVFFSSYFKRALTEAHHWGYVAVLLLILGLRLKMHYSNFQKV